MVQEDFDYYDHHHAGLRFLQQQQDATTNNATNNSTTTTEDIHTTTTTNDAAILAETFAVYGSICIIFFLLFCVVRQHFPKAYTVRQWVQDFKNPLADKQFGYISWVWELCYFVDDELLENSGLDALCFLRVIRMGCKISLVAMVNAFWLFPIYATSTEPFPTSNNNITTDGIFRVNVANVPAGSHRLIATALASYLLFGYTMFLILKDFAWFIEKRHKFLSNKHEVRNFTVFVRNIPRDYRDNASLADFFKRSLNNNNIVLEAVMCVQTTQLRALVTKREQVVVQLEHALALERLKGIRPMHRASSLLTVPGIDNEEENLVVDSIDTYAADLIKLNQDITQRIKAIEAQQTSRTGGSDDFESLGELHSLLPPPSSASTTADATMQSSSLVAVRGGSSYYSSSVAARRAIQEEPPEATTTSFQQAVSAGGGGGGGDDEDDFVSCNSGLSDDGTRQALGEYHGDPLRASSNNKKSGLGSKLKQSLLVSDNDGQPYSAGFVTFSKLSAVHATLQMIQHEAPFCLEVVEAPAPDDVFWNNVSRTHKDLQLGFLFSMASTTALCLLWTIPMAFFASLSSVEGLRRQVKFIDDLLRVSPWLIPFFQQIAPYLVVIFNGLLPTILGLLSSFEGPIAAATVEASTFGKLAAFMIIQTFFVSALSGGIFEQLANIAKNPLSIIDLLATSLPSQSTYFIQIVFIGTVMPLGFELLRTTPLIMATIRQYVGPSLTEKERSKPFFIFAPLNEPGEFDHGDGLSNQVLFFMVLLVYAVIAPITAFVLFFCFHAWGVSCRHQFVYIYPKAWDSGGKMWTQFIGILILCMLIAEVTIFGLLLLKKSAVAVPLMIPLIVITALFRFYISQQHYRAAEYLSARACAEADWKAAMSSSSARSGTRTDVGDDANHHLFEDMRGAFVQPELQDKELLPEDLTEYQKSSMFGIIAPAAASSSSGDKDVTPPSDDMTSLEFHNV